MTAADGDARPDPHLPEEWAAHPPPPHGARPVPGYPHQVPPGADNPVYSGYEYGPPTAAGTNPMAVAALVASIVGFAPYFGGVFSIAGIVLGTVALNQIKQAPQNGYGLAVAGIVVGVATLIIGLIWTIYAMR